MRIVRRKIGVPVKSAKMSDYWLLVMNENVANELWISIKPHAFGLWKPKYCTHFGIMIISNVCSSSLHHGRKSMYFRHNNSANAYQRNGNAFSLCAQHIAAKSLQAYMLINAPMHSLRNKNLVDMLWTECVYNTHHRVYIWHVANRCRWVAFDALSLPSYLTLSPKCANYEYHTPDKQQ